MNLTRYFTPLYTLSLLLLGTGYLPPFEGFYEPSHFSSIRQIAAMGTIPVLGRSFLDEEVAQYMRPMPYSTGSPPFDKGMTYSKFIANRA